jgi:flavin-dependent dehydrogenase
MSIEYGQNIPSLDPVTQQPTVLKTSVCIVGSGAAGITAAWYLNRAGVDVILIDGSRNPSDPKIQPPINIYTDKELLDNGQAV